MEALLTLSIISNFSQVLSDGETLNSLRLYADKLFVKPNIPGFIAIQYYYGPSVSDYKRLHLSNANSKEIFNDPTFDNSKKTVVYLHGYAENAGAHKPDESIDVMVTELLKRDDVNIIVANYAALVWKIEDVINFEYIRAMLHIPAIGRHLGDFFRDFLKLCKCEDRMHIIGFSLGAQVAHYLASTIKQDGIIPSRITGLDPARPYFENNILKEHLQVGDANFVDIVHTNRGAFGWSQHAGNADFWPNKGGWPQPSCLANGDTTAKCQHYYAVYYYAASINNPKIFPAVRCHDEVEWGNGNCNSNEVVYFGYEATITTGDFFFSTSVQYPYGKGMAGISPKTYFYYGRNINSQ